MRRTQGAVRLREFTFEAGDALPLDLAYEAYGDETGDAVLVCHALTGSQRLARTSADDENQARAWWNSMVGPGKPIDTDEYFVVCVNVPGSCYGSTGPASTDPSGERYAFDFPEVTVTDWVDAQRAVLDELGVDRLHAVVGGSVGGMNVLEWAKRYPHDVRNIIPIATASRLNAQCLALDAIARRAIMSDPNWNWGDYYDETHPDHGLALARQIGHVMYLSEPSMREKFGRQPTDTEIEHDLFERNFEAGLTPYRSVESYLDYQAQSFVDRFDANSYLFLSSAMDNYDLADGYPTDVAALSDFRGRALVVSFTGDWHFPLEQSEHLVASLREAEVETFHHVVDSQYGHDAFLVETEKIGSKVRDFLATGT